MGKYTTKRPAGQTPVEALKHGDKRKNIPTAELHDFMEKYDPSGTEKMLYPRDPSLDPQLVWRGKDDQDREDLAVPVVPIYIQEKIQPRAIIENVRASFDSSSAALRTAQDEREIAVQPSLFADFNGIEFEELIEFYQHEQNWTNRMILGDSLYVMTSLAEKEGLKGKVQMIYLDPPYGIRFGSNWQVSTRRRDVRDGRAEDVNREPEVVKAFRDTWELGIHSYLSYLRNRFVAAHDLLTETGSIFVQIGDENAHVVRCVMDEVFGSANFAGVISFYKTSSQSTERIQSIVDFLLVYAKDIESQKLRPLLRLKRPGERGAKQYVFVISPDLKVMRRMTDQELDGTVSIPDGWKICRPGPTTSQGHQENRSGPYVFDGEMYYPSSGRHWSYDPIEGKEMDRLVSLGRIRKAGKGLATVLMADDNPATEYDNVWLDTGTGSFTEDQIFVVQTANKVIERCVLMTTDPGDLVVDPTCGSGTTAYVAEQWGRRWITVDTSRVALALARTRLMSARYPYYQLADSPEGVAKEREVSGVSPTPPAGDAPAGRLYAEGGAGAGGMKTEGDIRKGFVYKRVPHITLKSIANNPDIKEGMTREEIDAAINRHAETETLYDQPYEDNKRIRVSGPFTVESLSPHRSLSSDDGRPESEREGERGDTAGQFTVMIIGNLRKAGVQNRVKDERLVFERLEPFAGTWIQAEGEYTDKSGKAQRVAVSIGPEHATVGPEQVKEAAKEALRGAGFDMLVVCGFAFDAHAGETAKEFSPETTKSFDSPPTAGAQDERTGFVADEAKKYGKLPVLLAKMNPDLAMGDELLKKTGAGNLFMVFGEPDLVIHRVGADSERGDSSPPPPVPLGPTPRARNDTGEKLVVEIRGVDVYDPTTGEIRSDSTDDIACWFIDTNYNEESFFVRHAYFTGADEPYERLKRALRAEVDEAAWSTLYSTRSFPFDRPETGKIAVKVINHYGDEVLKVFRIV